jgi:hypothetical protein
VLTASVEDRVVGVVEDPGSGVIRFERSFQSTLSSADLGLVEG